MNAYVYFDKVSNAQTRCSFFMVLFSGPFATTSHFLSKQVASTSPLYQIHTYLLAKRTISTDIPEFGLVSTKATFYFSSRFYFFALFQNFPLLTTVYPVQIIALVHQSRGVSSKAVVSSHHRKSFVLWIVDRDVARVRTKYGSESLVSTFRV